MAIETPFDAVASQFATRLEGLKDFIVASPALQSGEGEVARFGYQWLIVAYWAFLESFYKGYLFMGAALQPEHFRAFVLKRTHEPHRRKEIASWNDVRLGRHAQSACSLEENAKKLRSYSQHLFGVGPFPNEDVDHLVTDLAKVRNLIVHHGGLPEPSHAQDVRTSGLIVPTARVGVHQFHRLNLSRQSVMDFMVAGGLAVMHLNQAVKAHPQLGRRVTVGPSRA